MGQSHCTTPSCVGQNTVCSAAACAGMYKSAQHCNCETGQAALPVPSGGIAPVEEVGFSWDALNNVDSLPVLVPMKQADQCNCCDPRVMGAAACIESAINERSRSTQPVEETSQQRQKIKAISGAIAQAEREGGYAAARRVFEMRAGEVPAGLAWKLHLELAECAKRGASLVNVQQHLSIALQAQPHALQVWLEACRTYDELGELRECRNLLEKSLDCCVPGEQLVLKLVRILERMGDRPALRSLVGSLRGDPPERTCKVLLEAAHCEVRAGNGKAARALLRCLMLRLPHQGPIFCEGCRLENIVGNPAGALSIAEFGVQTCLKYGPLWFVLLRQAEKFYGATAVRQYVGFALKSVCHELHWKFHFEAAAAFSREGNVMQCRQSIGNAALTCPRHLRWKVWLLAARSELWDGSVDASRAFLARASLDAPARVQASVCIERARTEELLGSTDAARATLQEAHTCEGHDWKVFLEDIFMEARQGSLAKAKAAALHALELHPATGRLWSALIALEHGGVGGVEGALVTFHKAVEEVPKSGEVWCEGARIFMNPLGQHFNLDHAHKCLEFAVHLTPQYGDSFLELLRLRFLLELRRRINADPITRGLLAVPTPSRQGSSPEGRRLAAVKLIAQRVCQAATEELMAGRFKFDERGEKAKNGGAGDAMVDGAGFAAPYVPLRQLEVLCAYADPNYGFLWFWCRQSSLSTPREVLQQMREEISSDLASGGGLWCYVWAIVCRLLGPATGAANLDSAGLPLPWETDTGLHARDFTVGSLHLSRCFTCGSAHMEQAEQRRLIFGSDILSV
eukprot:gnl/TRDRNA2_/TRDRNA2_169021_c0_seq2.p1 gnl/TRDRNA2_/TRDRNA2_169021_c0~~gnl/TRDRNA2_/TRDRNA2_169021_c0_seq2.p1  ORF type:complete len:801 (-),score=144.78 gnl/TRDRNA2_/TRDRNA2_169021_c0_seq2:122-2524(-)